MEGKDAEGSEKFPGEENEKTDEKPDDGKAEGDDRLGKQSSKDDSHLSPSTATHRNVWGDHRRSFNEPLKSNRSSGWFNKKEETVGFYRVGKTIGAGGVGVVKKGRHILTNEIVAVKLIEMDEKKKKFIKREIAISRVLRHPHIVAMHDVIYDDFDKEVHLVFDLVDGGALLDYIISHGHLKEKLARPFFRQMLSAVDYCHRNCIVHRDLKIENILIDKRGVVKLIDFGLANLYSPKTWLRTNCGSIYFAAPELLVKSPYRGPEVDIWSLGIILYVMLCGRVPFEDKNLPKLYEKIKSGDIKWQPNILLSDDAVSLIKRMLTVDRNKRMSLEEVMNSPWVRKGYSVPPSAELAPREPITSIDEDIVEKMSEFDWTPSEIRETLETAKTKQSDPYDLNPIVSAYYLVREKLERDELEKTRSNDVSPASELPKSASHSDMKLSSGSSSSQTSEGPPLADNIRPRSRSSVPTGTKPSIHVSSPPRFAEAPELKDAQQKDQQSVPNLKGAHSVSTSSTNLNEKREGKRSKSTGNLHSLAYPGKKNGKSQGGESELKNFKVKGLLSVSTTSTKPPYIIKDEIERVLQNHKIQFERHGWTLACQHMPESSDAMVIFEITVVKVQFMNMHGVTFKRYVGEGLQYKAILQKIISDLRL
eukprot:Lithocolla_globosa_v1_NODE_2103_length_2166_cov_21.216011.p1 type:complete len:650 gc:universal NODE_2103_length_2166_cov_21.216011:2048-99(-)